MKTTLRIPLLFCLAASIVTVAFLAVLMATFSMAQGHPPRRNLYGAAPIFRAPEIAFLPYRAKRTALRRRAALKNAAWGDLFDQHHAGPRNRDRPLQQG